MPLVAALQGCLGQDAGAQKLSAQDHPPIGATAPAAAPAELPVAGAPVDPSVSPPASDALPDRAQPGVLSDEGGGSYSIDTTLVVDHDVTLKTRMSGIVREIDADRGARVRKGDSLLTLINHDLELAVQRAQITARQRQADLDRARQLYAERTLSKAQLEEAQYAAEGSEVDVLIAQENLEKSIVRAPFDGLIVERYARLGQKVVEDDNTPLFRLTTLSPLQARLYLPEEVARTLARGDRVEVRARHVAGVTTTGTIEWISRVIDAGSGTAQAIVSVPDGERSGALTPGTAVTVVLRPAASR